jgi:peptidoglycan/xylan/chitin deacetylase (PgdA/CDA1 family)
MSAQAYLSARWIGCAVLGIVLIAGCGNGGSAAPQGSSTLSGPASPSVPSTSTPGTASATPPPSSPAAPRPTPTPRPPVKPSPTPPPPAKPPTSPAPVPARLAGTDWERIPTTRHVVALTFDAGANADAVSSILATLRTEGVPATFFLTGDFVNQFPTAARQIAAAERIGNHSVDHPYFTALTPSQITAELSGARTAIGAVTGADPRPWFRFPYGDRNAATIAAVNAAGYVPVRWTVDTLGWKGTSGGITAQIVRDRVINALQPGEIVLMHCGSNPTDHTTLDAVALGGIIETIKAMGYGFVTLDALLS